MKISAFGPILCSAIIGVMVLSSPAFAKTTKECQAEWRANKAANQAKGITEKAYVAQCKSGGSAEKTKATPAAAGSKAKEKNEKKAEKKAEKKEKASAKVAAPVAGGTKTTKECQAEWRANKAANQAKGITEKAYVAQCKAGGSAEKTKATPAAAPTAKKEKSPAKAATQAAGEKKTAKECEAEWRANKAANQAKGITEKAYVAQCRAGGTMMKPAETPAPSTPTQTQTKIAPTKNAPAKPAAQKEPAPATGAPAGANQYVTESAAQAHCRSGTVVWANLDSKIYHFAGYSDYGHTKKGAYMCEKDATEQGMRAAKNEKHP